MPAPTVEALAAEVAALRGEYAAFVEKAIATSPRLNSIVREEQRKTLYARFPPIRALPTAELLVQLRELRSHERAKLVESTTFPDALRIARDASDADRLAWLAMLTPITQARIRFELADLPPMVKLQGNAKMRAPRVGEWGARTLMPLDVITLDEWIGRMGSLEAVYREPQRNEVLGARALSREETVDFFFAKWRDRADRNLADCPTLPGEPGYEPPDEPDQAGSDDDEDSRAE